MEIMTLAVYLWSSVQQKSRVGLGSMMKKRTRRRIPSPQHQLYGSVGGTILQRMKMMKKRTKRKRRRVP